VRVQQIPWSAAHEKLLTAYAGDSMPDAFQLGNTWIPEFVALRAIEPLDERLKRLGRKRLWPTIFPASSPPTGWTVGPTRCPGMWIPGCSSTVPICSSRPVSPSRRPLGTDWLQAMTALKAAGAIRRATPSLLPINEWQLPVILALQRGAAAAGPQSIRRFPGTTRFERRSRSICNCSSRGLAPPVSNAQMANLYQEFAKGAFAVYASGPWNIGEFGRRLPAAMQAAVDDTAPPHSMISPLSLGDRG
jgi:multiple sugar transport system substrate-binding protein